jgi:hypothetical protein
MFRALRCCLKIRAIALDEKIGTTLEGKCNTTVAKGGGILIGTMVDVGEALG